MRHVALWIALASVSVGLEALADAPIDVPKASDNKPALTPDTTATPPPAQPSATGQVQPATTATATAEVKAAPARFYDFSLELTAGDGSGLNAVGENYRNELAFYIEPKWAAGDLFFRDTRFKSLTVSGYWALTQQVHGVDPSSFGSSANAGPETPCSSPNPSTNGGVIDPTQVGYCHPAPNDRRLDQGDMRITIKNPGIYTIPAVGVSVNPSLRFYLPTSLESQYQSLQTAVMPSLSLSRDFLKEKLHLAGGVGFTKNFHKYTTPSIFVDQSGTVSDPSGNPYDGLTGLGLSNFFSDPSRVGTIGGYNVNYQWTGSVDVSYDLGEKWSFDALYIYMSAVPYGHSCVVNTQGLNVDTCATGDAVAASSASVVARPGNHDFEVFWATVTYKLNDWMAFNLAWINWVPAIQPPIANGTQPASNTPPQGGTLRQPFISTDYNAFTTVQLSATFTVDKLAARKF